MTRELDKAIKHKIVQARLQLYRSNPFFMMLALYFNPKPVDWLPTAAVDGKGNFYINEEFAAKLSVKDMMFVIAHEVMHIVTQTCGRMPPRGNPLLFNVAADAVINYMLCHPDPMIGAGIPMLNTEILVPIFGHHPQNVIDKLPVMKDDQGNEIPHTDWAKYDGWIAEDIYIDLLKTLPSDKVENLQGGEDNFSRAGNGEGQSPFEGWWWDDTPERSGRGKQEPEGESSDGPIDTGMSEEDRMQWATRVAAAAIGAKAAGKLPGVLSTFVTDILKPKHNWKNEVRRYASRALRKRYDWKRISRRTAGIVRTPGKSPYAPSAVLYMDTSGSMSDKDLIQCISEMHEIIRLCEGKCWLILGDCQIYWNGDVNQKAIKSLPVQRGGTDFRPIFKCIEESGRPKPNLFIGFTDCEGPFPDDAPDFPVIWCRPKSSYKLPDPPWGKVIDIEIKE
jgi:predicted metal-dependent peptidase